MARKGGVLAPSTRLQHLGNSEVLKRKDGAIPRVSLDLGGGPGKGLPESWHTRDIIFRSHKETVFLAISFLLHPAVTNNRSHRGRCSRQALKDESDVPCRWTQLFRSGRLQETPNQHRSFMRLLGKGRVKG